MHLRGRTGTGRVCHRLHPSQRPVRIHQMDVPHCKEFNSKTGSITMIFRVNKKIKMYHSRFQPDDPKCTTLSSLTPTSYSPCFSFLKFQNKARMNVPLLLGICGSIQLFSAVSPEKHFETLHTEDEESRPD